MVVPTTLLQSVIRNVAPKSYGDFGDRLNFYYTPILLVFLAILVTTKQYLGAPIKCWIPAEFKFAWAQYTDTYCFVQNTYFVPYDNDAPPKNFRPRSEISYYQWVPVILLFQAFLFTVPDIIWDFLCMQLRLPIKAILSTASDVDSSDDWRNRDRLRRLAEYFRPAESLQKYFSVSTAYAFVKLLAIGNSVVQFMLTNRFLGSDTRKAWGYEIAKNLTLGYNWETSGIFPRVTLCDFEVSALGQIHSYSVECVLTVNMLNEKVYVWLWFWVLWVLMVSLGSMVYSLVKCLFRFSRERMIKRYLLRYPNITIFCCQKFTQQYVGVDEALIMGFIRNSSSDYVCAKLVCVLWQIHNSRPKKNV